MTMTRSDATTYLANSLSQLLSDAGITATDTAGGLKEPVDDALLAVGTDYEDLATATVATADVIGFRAVLRYMGLLRIRDAIANRVDISLDGPQMSKRRSQAVSQLDRLVADAKLAAEPHMESGGATFSAGSITLDFLEPEAT